MKRNSPVPMLIYTGLTIACLAGMCICFARNMDVLASIFIVLYIAVMPYTIFSIRSNMRKIRS